LIDYGYFKAAQWKINEWEKIYAPLNVMGELEKMKLWLDANPRRRKKRYERFVINWLNKAHASVVSAQVRARLYARVGKQTDRKAPDYSSECEEILKRYPDLA
jgi:hypothetical protein